MRIFRRLSIITLLLSTLISFNVYAMKQYNQESLRNTPLNEETHADRTLDYRWTWVNDESCVRFNLSENSTKGVIERNQSCGMLSQWAENGTPDRANVKTRDTYSGKWSQSEEGIWSFTFDDYTIPVGVTKIDNVLYAFNTFGELKEGYEYYTGFKTEADGLVKADSAEFTQWLGTQYVPDCTSHE